MKIPILSFVLNYLPVSCENERGMYNINISYSLSTVYNKYIKFKLIKFQNSF